jgi:nucleoside-diphosphate-sugar epimerase
LADLGAARRILGYEPICDFRTGLKATLDWYRQVLG